MRQSDRGPTWVQRDPRDRRLWRIALGREKPGIGCSNGKKLDDR